MNNNLNQSEKLVDELKENIQKIPQNISVKISPSFVNLYPLLNFLKNSNIEVISQNMHQKQKGAFTGEVSCEMLKTIGIKTTILGHSERREYFNETEEILKEKVDLALENNMEIIFCIGEILKDRKTDNHFNIIKNQIKKSLFHLSEKNWEKINLAYEPVWAIGTGETASANQAQEMHNFIRALLTEKYNKTLSESISILYGGSCNPNNAKEIFSKKDVDGGLIGGASLIANDFIEITKSF